MIMGFDKSELIKALYNTMPYADIGGYNPSLFESFAEHGLFLREIGLSQEDYDIFFWYVMHPRVNNEELSDCRKLFYSELAPRIKGMSKYEAALEVNCWCAENAAYRSTDDRTASALAVYSTGYGRCGEESVFAVNALRSVGIPARQVYAPWWSHCDDNHAWCEVYIDGRWHFLGACEPEPILDRGWFTAAASRAMMIHGKLFCRDSHYLPVLEKQYMMIQKGITYINCISRYAETTEVLIKVLNGGKPEPGVQVKIDVFNMNAFRNIAVLESDDKGELSITLGL